MEPQIGIGLRRRNVENANMPAAEEPPPPAPLPQSARPRLLPRTPEEQRQPSDTSSGLLNIKLSHVYCLASTILAILAIIAATPTLTFFEVDPIAGGGKALPIYKASSQWTNSIEHVARAAAVGVAVKKGNTNVDPETRDLLHSIQQWWNTHTSDPKNPTADAEDQHFSTKEASSSFPFSLFRWFKPSSRSGNTNVRKEKKSVSLVTHKQLLRWVDPSILNPTMTLPTEIIDKILTSTPRLIVIANFLLAMTYLLHSFVASWFLGNQQGVVVDWSTSAGARERMGGFLVFKLLLISAVVAPDTLDLLILLTWYTILSCLRSLDHLAAFTTTHLAVLGQPPRPGVLKLLALVLICNIFAAACCAALFHSAGIGMVLLLTCDCALLMCDLLTHILKHLQCVLEEMHSQTLQSLETRQLELHTGSMHGQRRQTEEETKNENDHSNEAIHFDREVEPISAVEIQEESRRLDHEMEGLELTHARHITILDMIEFVLELLCHLLTVAHFCHIWSLHGVQFTLIDGVLALHLHSALSSGCKKITERRNIYSIARDLQLVFPIASEQELRKASLAGDVCCICLNTMTNNVKKVHCGHLYHTHCLREVVERAQSLQAAKCPLCRASILDGRRPETEQSPQTVPAGNNPVQLPHSLAGEHALFRFSTEELFPGWFPIPNFSFEVVRRPSPQPAAAAGTDMQQEEEELIDPPVENVGISNEDPQINIAEQTQTIQPQQQEEDPQPSFFRRFLVLAGAIPMSPEEETRALVQLTAMFPQYARTDLLRELRARGSAEAVAEAVLMGLFIGVARGPIDEDVN